MWFERNGHFAKNGSLKAFVMGIPTANSNHARDWSTSFVTHKVNILLAHRSFCPPNRFSKPI